jgi:sedoheptulokinase
MIPTDVLNGKIGRKRGMIHAGIDIGTTNIAVIVFDSDEVRVVAYRSLPNPRLKTNRSFEYAQDSDAIEQSVRILLDEIIRSLGRKFDSLCVTGQVHGIVYYNAQGKAVSPLYTWLDQRAMVEIEGVSSQRTLLDATGVLLPSGYGLLAHLANRRLKSVPVDAVGFTGILEYITSRLIGTVIRKSDPSCLATFGAYDVVGSRFNKAVLTTVFGSPEADFMENSEPFDIAGQTPDGIPVAYAVGDNQAGFFGMVADPMTSALVSIGTSGQLSLYSTSSQCPESMELRPFLGLGYLHVGATLTAGKAYETLHRFFRSVFQAAGIDTVSDERLFDLMKQEADRDRDLEPLVVRTKFSGSRKDPALRGSIKGIGLDNLSMGNLTRGVVAGIIDELYQFARDSGAAFNAMSSVVATGSAVRRNHLFREAMEREFGLPVHIAQIDDGAGLGAALVGAIGIGAISLEQKQELVRALLGQ